MTNHSRKDSKQGSVLAFSEINSSVEVQASQWLARLDGETPSLETRQEFKAWINADPAHRKAFEEYIEFWDEMNILTQAQLPSELEANGYSKEENRLSGLGADLYWHRFLLFSLPLLRCFTSFKAETLKSTPPKSESKKPYSCRITLW